ncbi:MAG TPA: hypothetical protein VHX61_07535 [Rhizomicrobium sp.]|jgi:hypothetical protein|nr:hypothetical protein [Rhizomicrobium sp.]
MSAENITDRPVTDEGGDARGAREIGCGVIDQEPAGHHEVARKEQAPL